MRANFGPCLARVLQNEGGYCNNPRDPGGPTNRGITQHVYDDWRRSRGLAPRDVRNIEQPEIAAIYRRLYWDRVKGDDLPSGVDYAVFDFAVNSGPNRAARFLQQAVEVNDDGSIGPATLAAVSAADPRRVIHSICTARQAFIETLPTFVSFGTGWTKRIVNVEMAARGMV